MQDRSRKPGGARTMGVRGAIAAVLLLAAAAPAAAQDAPLPPPTRDLGETERNRTVIEQFARLFWIEKDVEQAFTRFVHPDYIQHNPLAADGRDVAIEVLGGFFAATPSLEYDIHRILVDGNLAAVHTHMRMGPDDRGSAVVDIFRLEDGLIVEHWDVIQAVPEESANDHPMF